MIIAWATRTMVLVYQPSHNIEPQSGTSPLRRRQSTTPSGSPPARGRGSPGQIFARPFASSCGRGGALANFSASPFCEINKKLVWRLGVDGIHWLLGLRGVGPTPLQATFRNTSPYRGVPKSCLLVDLGSTLVSMRNYNSPWRRRAQFPKRTVQRLIKMFKL